LKRTKKQNLSRGIFSNNVRTLVNIIWTYKDFGLPGAIRTDNGVPFASGNALFGLSKLSVWWLRLGRPEIPEAFDDKHWYCEIPYTLRNRGTQLRIVPEGLSDTASPETDPSLFKLIRRAHDWRRQLESGSPRTITDLAAANGVNASYFTRVLRLAYLAPDIVEAIVTGRQPPNLSANRLVRMLDLPMGWSGQREYLGLPAA